MAFIDSGNCQRRPESSCRHQSRPAGRAYSEGHRIGDQAGRVTQVGRTEDRQDDIRAMADTVVPERLAEILSLALHSPNGGRVPQPGDADRRVHDKTRQSDAGPLELHCSRLLVKLLNS